jgi:hypothetical protein
MKQMPSQGQETCYMLDLRICFPHIFFEYMDTLLVIHLKKTSSNCSNSKMLDESTK